jgi:molecular chaperone HtpG
MADNFNFIVNSDQSAVKHLIATATDALKERITPLFDEIESLNKEISATESTDNKDKSEEEKESQRKSVKEKEDKVADLRSKEHEIIADFGKTNNELRQIIDLALLRVGLLKGANLDKFIKRSVELLG